MGLNPFYLGKPIIRKAINSRLAQVYNYDNSDMEQSVDLHGAMQVDIARSSDLRQTFHQPSIPLLMLLMCSYSLKAGFADNITVISSNVRTAIC